MLELFFRSPRLFFLLIGVACVVTGWQFLGMVKRDDSPVRRALGPAGIPVEVLVVERPDSYPKVTTLQYDHAGQRYSEVVVADPVADKLPLGSRQSFRMDPENSKSLVRAGAPMPGTTGKGIIFIVVIVTGVLMLLCVIWSWIR